MARKPAPVFVFKVVLVGDPGIWRRIAIRGDQTLADLHGAIYRAFDREEEHLFSFYLPPPGIRSKSMWGIARRSVEFSAEPEDLDPWAGLPLPASPEGDQRPDIELPDIDALVALMRRNIEALKDRGQEAEARFAERTLNEMLEDVKLEAQSRSVFQVRIDELDLAPRRKLYYLFDFGDEWWHELTVERAADPAVKGKRYPAIVERHGASPPQYPDWDDDEGEDDEEAA